MPKQYIVSPVDAAFIEQDYGVANICGRTRVEAFDFIAMAMGLGEFDNMLDKYKRGCISVYLDGRNSRERNEFDFLGGCIRALKRSARRKIETAKYQEKRAIAKTLADPVTELAGQYEHLVVLAGLPAEKFYTSLEWRKARFEALTLAKRRCILCGAKAPKAQLHVDHILSRISHPRLAFTLKNLRVLCEDCHHGRHYADGAGVHLIQGDS